MYIATWRLKIQGRSDDREWNQARSKTDTVDRPVRTAHTFVHHYNRTQYCSTESFISSPLPPDQYQVQVWSSWDGGRWTCKDVQTSVAVHRCNGFNAKVRPSNSRASLPTAEKTVSSGTAACGLNWMKSGSSFTPCFDNTVSQLHLRGSCIKALSTNT